jgi:TonB family protein
MNRARTLALLLACAASPLAAQEGPASGRWTTVLTGGDSTVVAIDSARIDRTGDSTFVVSIAVRFPRPVTLPSGESVDREVDTEELDCGGGRSRPMASRLYAGETQVKTAPLPGTWAAVAPGRRAVFEASCAWLLGGFAARLPLTADLEKVEELPELVNRDAVSAAITREYPRTLLDLRQSGTVVLRFRVRENGTVDRPTVRVENATNPGFGEAARRVVYGMRFRPARIRQRPVMVWVTLPIVFQIAERPGTS